MSQSVAVDNCPECGAAVRAIDSTAKGERANYRANPCRHLVSATMWPDRIQLEQP